MSRDVVRCFRALRALRLLRITTKFAIMRNMLFLLGRIAWSLLVSVVVNSIFLLACTLIAQELWNSSLQYGCYSTATGIREWPPRKCDPAARSSLTVGGFSGGFHGRRCPPGFGCISGKEAASALEDPTVTTPIERGVMAAVGLQVLNAIPYIHTYIIISVCVSVRVHKYTSRYLSQTSARPLSRLSRLSCSTTG